MREAMNATSEALARDEDEFAAAGIERAPCRAIDCARVAAAPAALECRLVRVVDLPGAMNRVVFGEVVGVHLRDDCLVDGRFDVTRFQPLARLGYRDYTHVRDTFEIARPGE
jgi:flavin reductase (DIM6/NTAB) family NADH-FMN oxidoreductase RutF